MMFFRKKKKLYGSAMMYASTLAHTRASMPGWKRFTATKQKQASVKYRVIYTLISGLFLYMFLFFITTPHLRIDSVVVSGYNMIPKQQFVDIINTYLSKRTYKLFPHNHYFFIDSTILGQELKNTLKLSRVEVNIRYPNLLDIVVDEGTAALVLESGDEKFFVSTEGVITLPVTDINKDRAVALPRIVINLTPISLDMLAQDEALMKLYLTDIERQALLKFFADRKAQQEAIIAQDQNTKNTKKQKIIIDDDVPLPNIIKDASGKFVFVPKLPPINIGDTFITPMTAHAIIRLMALVPVAVNQSIHHIVIHSISEKDTILRIILDNNLEIMFDPLVSLDDQVEFLTQAWTRLTTETSPLKYIDVRFGNFIYYKKN